MKKPHENWFWFAKDNLAFAESGFEDGFYAQVCFLSQQAVEKAIKGFLVVRGRKYPKIHDLISLLGLMEVDWLDGYVDTLKDLSAFYIPLHYPDALAGSLPEGLPDKEQAKNALEGAKEIVALIESKI